MDAAPINKTMDRDDLLQPECRYILAELFALMRQMRSRGADYSSWYGRVRAWPSAWEHVNRGPDYQPWPGNPDELAIPWFLLWEIAWLLAHTPLRRAARVLDMGGAGSLFSCLLAARGCEVHAIDIDAGLCDRARLTADRMNWRLRPRILDMTRLDYPDASFDHVFSVCVFEHLPVSGRIECNRQVARVLRPGGTASYTFDYANPQAFGRLDHPADVRRQFIEPSGLDLRGDEFRDNGKRYLAAPDLFGLGRFTRAAAAGRAFLAGTIERPQAWKALWGDQPLYTFGAVFLQKPSA